MISKEDRSRRVPNLFARKAVSRLFTQYHAGLISWPEFRRRVMVVVADLSADDVSEEPDRADKLVWSDKTPTEPGYYWYVTKTNGMICVGLLRDASGNLGARHPGSGSYRQPRSILGWTGRWAGPLPIPTTPCVVSNRPKVSSPREHLDMNLLEEQAKRHRRWRQEDLRTLEEARKQANRYHPWALIVVYLVAFLGTFAGYVLAVWLTRGSP